MAVLSSWQQATIAANPLQLPKYQLRAFGCDFPIGLVYSINPFMIGKPQSMSRCWSLCGLHWTAQTLVAVNLSSTLVGPSATPCVQCCWCPSWAP